MPAQVLLAVVIPALFGALGGYLLGTSKTGYLILSACAIVGGFAAGQEHDSPWQGAVRGLIGGALFGGFILLLHEATGRQPKATIPHPMISLLGITVVVGVVLGALGGVRRARRERRRAEEEEEEPGSIFDFSRIMRSELIAFAGSTVLGISLFLTWFSTSCDSHLQPQGCNTHSLLNGQHGSFDAFHTYKILQWLLVAACLTPFVLAYIIARGHELSWRPGELTMITGMLAFALVLLNGIILGRPGTFPHNVDISIGLGYPIALVGAFLISFGGFVRQASSIRGRKPPGVL